MRTLKFFIIFGSLFLYSCTSIPNKPRVVENKIQEFPVEKRCVINGVLKGGYEGFIYMMRDKEKDSTLVEGGIFCFEGTVSHPKPYWLHLSGNSDMPFMYVEAKEIDLRVSVRTNTIANKKIG